MFVDIKTNFLNKIYFLHNYLLTIVIFLYQHRKISNTRTLKNPKPRQLRTKPNLQKPLKCQACEYVHFFSPNTFFTEYQVVIIEKSQGQIFTSQNEDCIWYDGKCQEECCLGAVA